MTPAILEVLSMFCSGLASSRRRSARLPAASVPVVASVLKYTPTFAVPVRSAWYGVSPASTIDRSSRWAEKPGTFQNCGASDPSANGTPASWSALIRRRRRTRSLARSAWGIFWNVLLLSRSSSSASPPACTSSPAARRGPRPRRRSAGCPAAPALAPARRRAAFVAATSAGSFDSSISFIRLVPKNCDGVAGFFAIAST